MKRESRPHDGFHGQDRFREREGVKDIVSRQPCSRTLSQRTRFFSSTERGKERYLYNRASKMTDNRGREDSVRLNQKGIDIGLINGKIDLFFEKSESEDKRYLKIDCLWMGIQPKIC